MRFWICLRMLRPVSASMLVSIQCEAHAVLRSVVCQRCERTAILSMLPGCSGCSVLADVAAGECLPMLDGAEIAAETRSGALRLGLSYMSRWISRTRKPRQLGGREYLRGVLRSLAVLRARFSAADGRHGSVRQAREAGVCVGIFYAAGRGPGRPGLPVQSAWSDD